MIARSRGTRKRLFVNVILVLATSTFSLFLAEIALRLFGHNPPMVRNIPLFEYSDTLGWIGRPNLQTVEKRGRADISFAFNRWGFRDRQPPPTVSLEGKRRVMFLGDSFIMGLGSPEEERASNQLQKADSTLYCYNFGIDGFGTDQELLVLKKYGPVIKPDVVLLFFCINDLITNESNVNSPYNKPQYHVKSDGSLLLSNVPVPRWSFSQSWLNWAKNHSALVYTIWELRANFITRRMRPREGQANQQDPRGQQTESDTIIKDMSVRQYTGLTIRLLQELQFECRRLGAEFIVFSAPSSHGWTVTRDYTPPEMVDILNGCRLSAIKTLDLFPIFRQDYLQHREKLYLFDNCHWNARGGMLVADEVLKAMNTTNAATELTAK